VGGVLSLAKSSSWQKGAKEVIVQEGALGWLTVASFEARSFWVCSFRRVLRLGTMTFKFELKSTFSVSKDFVPSERCIHPTCQTTFNASNEERKDMNAN